jgi:hypothetical protein
MLDRTGREVGNATIRPLYALVSNTKGIAASPRRTNHSQLCTVLHQDRSPTSFGISSPTLAAIGEVLECLGELGIADSLCGLDLLHLAVKGSPAHALGFIDGISDAAICTEALAALEPNNPNRRVQWEAGNPSPPRHENQAGHSCSILAHSPGRIGRREYSN